MLGISVALPEEKNTLGKTKKYSGKIDQLSDQSLIVVSGTGPENAREAALLLLDHGITALVSWGCAAALDDALQPGDLIIPEQLKSTSGERYLADPPWHNRLVTHLSSKIKVHNEAIIQSEGLVTTASEKSRLFYSEKAIAVDMESFALAQLASETKLPFLSVRAIADPASMPLPQSVIQAINPQGGIALSVVLKNLAGKPSEITTLIQLGLHFHAAQKTLKRVRKLAPTLYFPPEVSTPEPARSNL
ncbi:MAG: phosphorylase [Methylococcales bacterium]